MLICLGGVCVPYTAVVPIVILGLKWILEKLGLGQYLPKFLQDMLQVNGIAASSSSDKCCAASNSKEETVSTGPSKVQPLESMEEYEDLLRNSGSKVKVVYKFTSSWCKPCKKVQPFFEQYSSQSQYQKKKDGSNVLFRTIDVDEFDELSSKYNVSMMPTFLVLQGDKVLGTYAGSNEDELDVFLKENAGAA
ncbi:MAG: hypothetical protein SGBAC_006225 [Bacillariaceae sp.]